jgi:hypothetical protein
MKPRARLWTLLALLTTLPLATGADDTGCQSEDSGAVEQDRIYASYWLFYDAAGDTTDARAQFRFGSAIGTTLSLGAPASVAFDGQAMAFNALLDWHEVRVAGDTGGGAFVYTDAEGREHVNQVVPPRPIHFGDVPATLPLDAAYTLRWVGEPIGEGEDLEVVVASAANHFVFVRVDQAAPGATEVVLPADKLAAVGPGPALISLRRHRDTAPAEAPAAGGLVRTTYQPPDRAVTLVAR